MKLYFKYIAMLLKCQIQYRSSFIMMTIGQFLVSFTAFLGVSFMFSRFNSVDGFSYSEVLLCFSIVLMSFSITECFVRGFDVFPRLIKSGGLDRILVRPQNEIFQVLTSNIDFTRIGRLLQAIIMICYAIPASKIVWSADKILTLIIMISGGIVIFSALFVLYAGLSFFTIEGLEFMNIFTDGGREFGKYPFSIYGEGVLKFFTYIIPLALFQYYPFLYLIGKSDKIVYMFLPILGFVFMVPCYAFFKFGIKKYKSTGS
ncbi:MAG: ABC-2 family transporter protein [Oscillospiraceae bacterium]|nr:ABC-2 family transporter protein [Oscillospiraceae bacterium]